MARGRMVDKRVGQSKKIAKCTERARNLWFMMGPHLDRDGRIGFSDLEDLRTEIVPHFSWPPKIIAKALNELAEVGLIKLYPAKKYKVAIEYPRFSDFQQGLRYEREGPSVIEPYGETPETSGVFRFNPEDSGNEPLSLSLSLRKEGTKELEKAKINFDVLARSWKNITEEDKTGWRVAYPACDIDLCLLQMKEWLISNPRQIKSNFRKFIINWLKREQDRGGATRQGRLPGQAIGRRYPTREERLKESDAALERARAAEKEKEGRGA